ncbi:SAM-dependent methyltransferase [Streptosporangium amethystogenes]|uniref:SAM-dependent methyltransferase n=1 Tax=Streptosporangium amethystogenes TaxID=2002 RepID=UPI0037A0B387
MPLNSPNTALRRSSAPTEEITAFFDGFEPLEPGVVALPLWRPDGPVPAKPTVGLQLMYGGIACKR